VPNDKVKVLSYGVDLQRFHPVDEPTFGQFDVLFVGGASLRKGLPYLLAAYKALRHPRKTLTLAGIPERAVVERMRELGLWSDDILVLPSIEEGLAMVMAQALSCACPVIASRNTGAEDLYTDGIEGFIVDAGQDDVLAARLQRLADDPPLRQRMSETALERVRTIGGWSSYGEKALHLYEKLA
jgi:glycosyltransferase involved in cell wall biosynthesis